MTESSSCRGRLAVALVFAAGLAQAQPQGTAPRHARPNPLDPLAQVPAVVHASALAGYRRLGEDQRIDWAVANATVNRIGGWRAYAREAQQADAAPPAGGPGDASPRTPGAVPVGKPGALPAPGGHKTH